MRSSKQDTQTQMMCPNFNITEENHGSSVVLCGAAAVQRTCSAGLVGGSFSTSRGQRLKRYKSDTRVTVNVGSSFFQNVELFLEPQRRLIRSDSLFR